MEPVILGEFIKWDKPYDVIAAREHLEKTVIRFAHVVGNQGASFIGASFTDALFVIRKNQLLSTRFINDIQEKWMSLVKLDSWRGMFRRNNYRWHLLRDIAFQCNGMNNTIAEHEKIP